MLVLYSNDYVFHPGARDTGNDIALDRNEIMQGELEILNSQSLIEHTLEKLGVRVVYPSFRGKDRKELPFAAQRLLRDFSIAAVPQANVIELKLRNNDRQVALDTLSAIIDEYLADRAEIFQRHVTFGSEKARQDITNELKAAEDNLVAFQEAHQISDLKEQTVLLLHRISEIADEKEGVAGEIGNLKAQSATLVQALQDLPAQSLIYQETDISQEHKMLTDRLTQLQIQQADLKGRYQNDYALVRNVQRQINMVQGSLHRTPARETVVQRTGINTVYNELFQQNLLLTSRLRGLQAKLDGLSDELNGLQGRSDELVSLSGQYHALQRTRDVLEQSYRVIAQNAEETRLAAELNPENDANIRIIQSPASPAGGRSLRFVILVLGLIVGFGSAVIMLAARLLTQQVFLTPFDVERRTGMPVIASVMDAGAPAPTWISPHTDALVKQWAGWLLVRLRK
ncbi:GumC family protein [Komagataeibacter swingsii]|uniref:GumC family protein n=1 Tax=Komagataeibacter swingsii TaxID=215220 RepID=UPI0011B7C804|nr:hypothetical protein [Komagataeibacter swingsii]